MKIVDNFLSSEDFYNLSHYIFSPNMHWVYTPFKVMDIENKDLMSSQLYHSFCDSFNRSSNVDILNPIVKKLNIIALNRIKANLELYRGEERHYSEFHYDYTNSEGIPNKDMTTSIFYMNTNNGYTEFKDGTKIESVANRFVSFPSNTLHRGVTQTDTKTRVVINFNYFSEEG